MTHASSLALKGYDGQVDVTCTPFVAPDSLWHSPALQVRSLWSV